MKLAALFNVWDGDELLPLSIELIYPFVDNIIILMQEVSNYGEKYSPSLDFTKNLDKIMIVDFTPTNERASRNETIKRQIGIEEAHRLGCTHFFSIDCDEMYFDFEELKKEYIEKGHEGSFCEMFTYYKLPSLRFENKDNYFVPFIHKLNKNTLTGFKKYPVYVDPTRGINCKDVILLSKPMHHYSWVRKNIERKLRNSSARQNLDMKRVLIDYANAKEGNFIPNFNQKLIKFTNEYTERLEKLLF